jgi:hypothetical protein
VNVPKQQLAASPSGLALVADARLSVDATWLSGDDQTDAAIRCRRVSPADSYYARFFPTGYYDIAMFQDGVFRTLASGTEPGAQRAGLGATNRLEFSCIGDALTMGANGRTLLTVWDATFAAGAVSLVAESTTGSQTGVEGRFDNFLAARP